MKRILLTTFVFLVGCSVENAGYQNEFIIKKGMQFEKAQKILESVHAKDTSSSLQILPPKTGEPTMCAYTIPHGLWLKISYNPENTTITGMSLDSYTGSHNFRGLPRSKLSSIEIDQINVKTAKIRKYIKTSDKEIKRIIDASDSLERYFVNVSEDIKNQREAVKVTYSKPEQIQMSDQGYSYIVWVFKDTLETELKKKI